MAKCEHCGADLPDGAAVCDNCGTLLLSKEPEENVQKTSEAITEEPANKDSSEEFEQSDISQNKTKAALCYAWIFVLIAVFEADDSEFVRYHRRQGLVLFAIEAVYFAFNMLILTFLHDYYNGIAVIIAAVLMYSGLIFLVALNVTGIISAAKGKAKYFPVITPIADRIKIKQ